MNADVPDPERPRLLDHAQTGIFIMKKEAASLRAPLGVALPGGDAPSLRELVHSLQVTVLVRVDAPVDQQPMRALHRVDDASNLIGFLDGQEFLFPTRGNERQHHHVGVEVQKDVLDELLRTPELGFAEPMLADEVSLHVEDELAAAKAIEGDCGIDRHQLFQLEETAGSARSGVGCVEGQQRARGTARGDHEGPAVNSTLSGILTRPRLRQLVRTPFCGIQRDWHELAVGGGVQLDGQALSLGVGVERHDARHPPIAIGHTLRN